MNLTLIETSPHGLAGSMSRYADLISEIFKGHESIKISRINLALPMSRLNKLPHVLQNWFHHAYVASVAASGLRRCNPDLFHIIDGSHAYVARWLPEIPAVATSHDVIPYLQDRGRFPARPPGKAAGWVISQSLKGLEKIDRIVSVSWNNRKDLIEAGINAEEIRVVHSAIPIDGVQNRCNSTMHLDMCKDPDQAYILHLGNDGFYKNRPGVLRIFSRITGSCRVRLKIAGAKPGAELLQLVRDLEIGHLVDFVVSPDDRQVAELYRNARLFMFPSIYEGFGWPPLEAMAFGCPVVCSNTASLPEVVGDAALTCPPENEEEMARLCLKVLEDSSLAESLIERGRRRIQQFSPEKMARELFEIYRDVIR